MKERGKAIRRRRRPIGGESLRSNLPPELTPYWHPEVADQVKGEMLALAGQEVETERIHDVIQALKEGGVETMFNRIDLWKLEQGDVDTLRVFLNGGLGVLYFPPIVAALGNQRARLRNAVGKRELEQALRDWRTLGVALMGIRRGDTPGFPPWFWKCIRLEFAATRREIQDLRSKFRELPPSRRRNDTLESFLTRRLRVAVLRSDWSPRKIAIEVMAERWSVAPGGLENWLKPAKDPQYVRPGEGTVKVIKLDGYEIRLNPVRKRSRRGRPPRNARPEQALEPENAVEVVVTRRGAKVPREVI